MTVAQALSQLLMPADGKKMSVADFQVKQAQWRQRREEWIQNELRQCQQTNSS